MKTKEENLQIWEERIKEKKKNQMTVSEWCEKNKLSVHQYYYWNRLIQESQKEEKTEFAEIEPVVQENGFKREKRDATLGFRILINEIQVTVPEEFNSEALAGLLKVLKRI